LDTLDEGWLPLPDMTVQEIYLFLAVIMQVGHNQKGNLKDYWSTQEQFYMAFCGSIRKHDEFFHILRLLHFCDNKKDPDKTDDNYD
jgi:hypothetical protein